MSPGAPVRDAVCAVIPCFNEAPAIGALVTAARAFVPEILVVDDCSTDATQTIAQAAGAIVVRHAANQGKGSALTTGFRTALERGFKAVVTLDGDGQHDPGEIALFLETYSRGDCDLVLGNRMNDTRSMPPVRRMTNRVTSWLLSRLAGRTLHDTQCGFRLVDLNFWQGLSLAGRHFDLESELLLQACRQGARIREVRVRTIYFSASNSKIRPCADTLRFGRLLWRSAVRTPVALKLPRPHTEAAAKPNAYSPLGPS